MTRLAPVPKLFALAVLALTAAVLTGCSAPGSDGASNEPAESSRFVACLKDEGVKAKLNASGQVMVRVQPPGEDGGLTTGEGAGVLMQASDEEGDWVAPIDSSAFEDDPDLQAGYEACESQYPEFAQPDFDPGDDPEMQAQMRQMEESALGFAKCARDEGFSEIADPDGRAPGAVFIPSDMDPDDLRVLLDSCYGDFPVAFASDAEFPEELSDVIDESVVIGAGPSGDASAGRE